jgi:hypothetical protein
MDINFRTFEGISIVQSHYVEEDKNKDRKRILETIKETWIIVNKVRKLNEKKAKLENLQEVKETIRKTS